MKTLLRTIAVMALVILTMDVSLGAEKQGIKLGQEHGQTPKSSRARVTTSVTPARLPPKPPSPALAKAPYAPPSGTGIRHSLSASTLGGPTTGKGTAVLGGMGAPRKAH